MLSGPSEFRKGHANAGAIYAGPVKSLDLRRSLASCERPGAVAAHIVKAAELAGAVHDEEKRPTGNRGGQVVTGVLKQRGAADGQPFPAKDGVALPRIDRRVVVPGRGEGLGAQPGHAISHTMA